MNDVLILLTNTFPFEDGEEFLIRETTYYNEFKKVYIIPVMARDFSKYKSISSKIEVIRLESKLPDNRLSKLLSCIKILPHKEIISEIVNLKRSKRLGTESIRQLFVEAIIEYSVFKEICRIFEIIKNENRSENIIIYSYWMSIQAVIACKLKKKYRMLKIVSRCHGGDLYEYRYRTNYIPFRNIILKSEDAIFTISENGKNYLEETYKEVTSNIIVSRLGTDPQYNRPDFNNEIGINLVSCSYCKPLKRIHLIIDALSGMNGYKVSWTHIGGDGEFDKLKKLASEKIPQNVKYEFMGYVENDKVQKLYSSGRFNLFINVSETEGIPVSIMEAMSYGMPIIATNVGGVSELVEDCKNGFLLPKDFEVEHLRNIIIQFVNMDPEEYFAMREKSYEIWKSKYHAQNNYTKFIKTIRELE